MHENNKHPIQERVTLEGGRKEEKERALITDG